MIQLNNVSKSFANLEAVSDLSFHIQKGEIFGLLGPNGAGKSTTISMICGLIKPDTGVISINGKSQFTTEVKKTLGLVPQSLALYEELTALDNLKFFANLYGLTKEIVTKRIDEVLSLVALSDRKNDIVKVFQEG